jgi:hypothetical protein
VSKKKKTAMQIAAARRNGDLLGDDLTELEKNFVQAFVGPAQGDAYKAAHMAGYASAAAGLLAIKRPQVRAAIDLVLEEIASIEGALTPLEIQACWRRLSQHPDPAVKLRATENAAKTYGMFIRKSEQTVKTDEGLNGASVQSVDEFLSRLDDDELEMFIAFIKLKKSKKPITMREVQEVFEIESE